MDRPGPETGQRRGSGGIHARLTDFVGDDEEALREQARQNIVLYTGLPFFRALLRASGFAEEAALMEQGDGMGG